MKFVWRSSYDCHVQEHVGMKDDMVMTEGIITPSILSIFCTIIGVCISITTRLEFSKLKAIISLITIHILNNDAIFT